MGILINRDSVAIVQGITGTQGSFHTRLMLEYGTKIVAGTTPGKGGTKLDNVPIYDTLNEAQTKFRANTSIIFVPAPYAADAAFDAIHNGVKTVVIITEHIPIRDAIKVMAYAKRSNAKIVGPNTPGVITPGESKLGIMPSHIFKKGSVGLASRSGTLTYEIAAGLTRSGLGQSTCVGLGGDPITGLNFVEVLEMFKNDAQTQAVALIGEIGGNLEELAAEYIKAKKYPKPVVAFVAGRSSPPGKRMGHAGAIITGKSGTAETKIQAFKDASIEVAEKPSDVAQSLTRLLKN